VLRQAQHERALVCHPLTPSRSVHSVDVELHLAVDHLMLVYRVTRAQHLLLPERVAERTDELWRSTCFELFAQAAGAKEYRELNFAPLFGWAAYDFSDWRSGMANAELSTEPRLVDMRLDDRAAYYPSYYELDVVLSADVIPTSARLGLSAVIEEVDGTKSYWALAHPPGAPDFHHPDCFALHIPALGSA
jgi:hypothetical protein